MYHVKLFLTKITIKKKSVEGLGQKFGFITF